MDQELRQKWASNLRSGLFVQGKKFLKRNECYCAFGVLCITALGPDCFQEQFLPYPENVKAYCLKTKHRNSYTIPLELQRTWKITHTQCTLVMHMNDVSGKSFAEIADVAETF